MCFPNTTIGMKSPILFSFIYWVSLISFTIWIRILFCGFIFPSLHRKTKGFFLFFTSAMLLRMLITKTPKAQIEHITRIRLISFCLPCCFVVLCRGRGRNSHAPWGIKFLCTYIRMYIYCWYSTDVCYFFSSHF